MYEIVLDRTHSYCHLFKTRIYQSKYSSQKIICELYDNRIYSKIYYLEEKKHGLYERFNIGPPKLIIKGYYKNNLLEGKYERWSKYNERYYAIYNYIHGNKEGLFNSFHPNGELKTEFTYLNGKIEGLCQQWSPDGQLILKCNYVHGKLDGFYQKWYYDGRIRLQCHYVDNIIDESQPYRKFPYY